MQISSQQRLPTTLDNAWAALNNIEVLKACIPGCEYLNQTALDQFELLVVASIGPVRAKFKGKLSLTDVKAPHSYTINFEGSGGAAGHGKGSAQVALTVDGAKATVLSYRANASVGGKIAQIGQRMVDMAAQKMAGDFFANFNSQILLLYQEASAEAPPGTVEPPITLLARVRCWLRRMLGFKQKDL